MEFMYTGIENREGIPEEGPSRFRGNQLLIGEYKHEMNICVLCDMKLFENM